jgi:UDP-GlcNAc3NAcA epimerase
LKIATIIGARPQFVKAAVVSPKLRSLGVEERVIHTGQHYDVDLSDRFFREFDLPAPDHNLGLGSGPHGKQTGRMLDGIESVLLKYPVDMVLVYGDTNSTLAGALVAAKLQIPIAHVEAGLRSFNRAMPEEINRIVTDHVAELLFVPNETARLNLEREGIAGNCVRVVGDVMYEMALDAGRRTARETTILADLGLDAGKYVVATIHRAENTNDAQRLVAIVAAFETISRSLPVVWPVHPRTRKAALTLGIDLTSNDSIKLIEPVGYIEMIALQQNAAVVVTDSGGMQKEAFFLGRPCVTVRTETEWVELIESGWNTLASPSDTQAIASAVIVASTQKPARRPNFYGSGNAGELIAKAIFEYGAAKNMTRPHLS